MDLAHCHECGAELRLGPDRCPLCGADTSAPPRPRMPEVSEVEAYQARVRRLREQLQELRRGAGAA